MTRTTLLAIALTGFWALPQNAFKDIRLLPVDEASSDPGLRRTRDALLAAVRDRHAQGVMQFVAPDVVLESVQPANGEGWLMLARNLDASPEFEDWRGLESALSLGGAFTTTRGAVLGRREFCAPYVFAALPEELPSEVRGEVAPWVLIRKDVEVRAAPDARSPVLMKLSYALLQAPGATRRDLRSDQMWKSVDLPGDREAFVAVETIRDPEGHHVCLAKVDGRWLVSAFTRHGSI